jgi:hypothetical protein
VLLTNRDSQLGALVAAAIGGLDIPAPLYERAVRRYQDVGRGLSDYWSSLPSSGEVYVQGSFRLGTVVRPLIPEAQYDIDLVCLRDLSKESTTQQALKMDVGRALQQYLEALQEEAPALHNGKRCWTLNYWTEPFHMDVLPAIPDPNARANAILLTDRDLTAWQHSNPISFATWFFVQMAEEFIRLREERAVEIKAMDIADVPEWHIKTTLQQSIQALKRHRDIFFRESIDLIPASIIITTLAARSYSGVGGLYEVLTDITRKMPFLVEKRNGIYWVENPVEPQENFTDRWRNHPEKARAFFDWIEQARSDFSGFGQDLGVHRVLKKIESSLGEEPARSAGAQLGTELSGARDAQRLGVLPSAGGLTIGSTRAIPKHTFHGDEPQHLA